MFQCGTCPRELITMPRRKCLTEGCEKQPNYGVEGKRAVYCAVHRGGGMINVVQKTCSRQGCYKIPLFGWAGQLPSSCSEHKIVDMINTKTPRCSEAGCEKFPSYGNPGEPRSKCKAHKGENMTPSQKTCSECPSQPSYGHANRPATRCAKHREAGMILTYGRCMEPNCAKAAHFRNPNLKHPILKCSAHKDSDMTSRQPRCSEPGCQKQPSYNLVGLSPAKCLLHKTSDMINVIRCPKRECTEDNCSKRRYLGYPGEKPSRCQQHGLPGMINVSKPRCEHEACEIYPLYQRSRSIANAGGKRACMACLRATTPGHVLVRTHVRKEQYILAELQRMLPDMEKYFVTWDCRIPGGCSGYKPDMIWDYLSHVVHAEVDEKQHASLRMGDEGARELDRILEIQKDMGGRLMVVIRLNPDFYVDSKGVKHSGMFREARKRLTNGEVALVTNDSEFRRRMQVFVESIASVTQEVPKGLDVRHLFFDEYDA